MTATRSLTAIALFALIPVQSNAADCSGASKTLADILKEGIGTKMAEAKVRDLIRDCPDLAEAHFQLGISLIDQGKPADAVTSLKKAIELKRDPLFYIALGNASVANDNLTAAEQAFDEALKIDPNSTRAMQGMSVVYVKQKRLPAAEEVLRRAIQITPEEAGLFYNLGLVLDQLGRLDEASESFRAASERRAAYAEALIHLGDVSLRSGNSENAEKAFRQASLHDPKNPLVWLGLASALEANKDLPGALSNCEKALALDPNNLRGRLNRAILLVKLGKKEDGVKQLASLLEANPKNAEVESALGWAFLQNQDLNAAQTHLEEALKLNDKDSFSYNNLGVLFELKGESDKAKRAFEQARSLSPQLGAPDSNLKTLDE
ncbi:MAG: tetratricopeptide repeat protein [Bdellovibrionota bacterium]